METVRNVARRLGVIEPILPENRTIFVNHCLPQTDVYVNYSQPQKFPDNRVISSKYTAINFLPKNLFEQFRRIANFYFLIISIIMLSIDSPISPWTTIFPLLFVITVTAFKQGYEDWLRHRADNEVNNRNMSVVREGTLQPVHSKDIEVGDMVMVQVEQEFPCDMILLASEDREGQCLITTANLDGETNLKVISSLPDTAILQSPEALNILNAVIECQQPIPDLYRFVGRMNIYNTGSREPTVKPLGPENVLLRGARLKNTKYVFGTAIYTGKDSKMALNSKQKGIKYSITEGSINKVLIFCLLWLLSQICLLTGLKYNYEASENYKDSWYFDHEDDAITVFGVFSDLLSFLVLLNYIIPISLYVTIEVQKFFGSMFFAWDIDMYDQAINETAKANTSDLNEMLGQIDYLFSDKTGTLTENDMRFRQCSINGIRYEESTIGKLQLMQLDGDQSPPLYEPDAVQEFLLVLALCHTVQVNKQEMKKNNNFNPATFNRTRSGKVRASIVYQASSPDEKALVEAANRSGTVFQGGTQEYLEVKVGKEVRRYGLLHVLEFDPTRKCMSVLVRTPEGQILVLCKGAETTILPKCTSGDTEKVLEHINIYAEDGLRTLVFGKRLLEEEEYNRFNKLLMNARTALENRDEKVLEAFNFIENRLHLVGATGVEDRLQEGVPETIQALREAGIKVWILTGDKVETAVNISHSCGHIHKGMVELRLTAKKKSSDCYDTLTDFSLRIKEDTTNDYCLVVDGMSLAYCLEFYPDMLREVCDKCTTVLCCRMSPLQKSLVVKLIKTSPAKPMTAAIGDGANDVSMIQEAHLGIGLMGKEGRQAARSSDYAFSRFRFLQKAVLVHGHWYYIRIAYLILYFFYKNFAFITCQFYYAFYSSYSQQTLFDDFFLTLFNITMTSLPIFIYGVFEQNYSAKTLLHNPSLYTNNKHNTLMSPWHFSYWIVLGLFHSVLFFFGTLLLWGSDVSLLESQKDFGIWSFGTAVITICFIVCNLKLMVEIKHWNGVFVFAFALTFAGYVILLAFYGSIILTSLVEELNMYWVYWEVQKSAAVWFSWFLIILIALFPDLVHKAIRLFFLLPRTDESKMKSEREMALEMKRLTLVPEKTPLARDYLQVFSVDGSKYMSPHDSVNNGFNPNV